jgi:hypothetical protein
LLAKNINGPAGNTYFKTKTKHIVNCQPNDCLVRIYSVILLYNKINTAVKMNIEINPQKTQNFNEYLEEIVEDVANSEHLDDSELPPMMGYTRLNLKRKKKWMKIFKPNEEMTRVMDSLEQNEKWVVLTESWCGDAAQNLPQLYKISELSDQVSLLILKRDENLDIMDQFLTNGGRSIPKLIRLNAETNEVLGSWGPRPQPVQEKVMQLKSEGKDYAEEIHKWYAKDRGKLLQEEFISFLTKNS